MASRSQAWFRHPALPWAALAAAVAGLLARHPQSAIDFRAYYENAQHVFGDGAAMYGPRSGTGWAGGVYRYPPIFLYLFRPLSWLPLAWAVALWGAAKIAALGGVVAALCRRWGMPAGVWMAPAALLLLPYAIQELRYGNAQWLIVMLVVAAFLEAESAPARGGLWLGLSAALKLWPVFFLPFLLVQRRWRMLTAALAAGAGFTLLPALWLGWRGWLALALQWRAQERSIGALNAAVGEIFYPGQSLHDVLMRYGAFIDYSRTPDAKYRQIDWLHLATGTVERLWLAAVIALAAAGLYLAWRRVNDGTTAALFCGLLVLQPHVHRILFITLLWPALWAAWRWYEGRLSAFAGRAFLLAVAVAALEPLVPGGARQRLFQVYGVDFLAVLLPLAVATALAAASGRTASPQAADAASPPPAGAAPPPGRTPRACVVMPVYNEGPQLAVLIARIFAQSAAIGSHELWLLVVDGESNDGGPRRLAELQLRFPRLRLLSRARRGLGDAYQFGIAHALDELRADLVIQMDGDGQHDAALLPLLIATAQRSGGAVIGSRFAPGGATPGLSRRRRATSLFASRLIHRYTGLPPLHDYTSGYRCLPARGLAACSWRVLDTRGYAFQAALIAELLLSGSAVTEVPMRFARREQGSSKLRPADYVEFLAALGPLRERRKAAAAAGAAGAAAGA